MGPSWGAGPALGGPVAARGRILSGPVGRPPAWHRALQPELILENHALTRLTGEGAATIFKAMAKSNTSVHYAKELQRLEARLDELLESCSRLQEENRSLREQQESVLAERAQLLQRNEQARTRVEAMISRLKGMESAP